MPDDYAKLIGRMIFTGQQQLIKSIQYNLSGYIKGIENLNGMSKMRGFYFRNRQGTDI